MRVEAMSIPGPLKISVDMHKDARGWFFEAFNEERYAEHGIVGPWKQDNRSKSSRGMIRGLHLQHPKGQGKLVSTSQGQAFDVAVDVRVGSPTFAKWVCTVLDEHCDQLWIPPGFAHGFVAMSDETILNYKCSENGYSIEDEIVIRWDDPDIGLEWPSDWSLGIVDLGPTAPIETRMSEKDLNAPFLKDIMHKLPRYKEPKTSFKT